MGWISTRSSLLVNHWIWNSTYDGLTRTNSAPTQSTTRLTYEGTSKKFSSEKTYLFRTTVDNFSLAQTYKRLDVIAFGQSFSYFSASTAISSTLPYSASGDSVNDLYLTTYFSPSVTADSVTYVQYYADYNHFATQSGASTIASVIKNLDVIEFDWKIQGWGWATSSIASNNVRYEGWRYNDYDESFEFFHYTKAVPNNLRHPANGFTSSNYLSKLITYDEFNLEFYFSTTDSTRGFLELYMTDNLPSNSKVPATFTASLYGQKIATFTASGTYSFYRLAGNRYLNFVANYSNTSNTYQSKVDNINIQGGYSLTDNNERFLFTNSDIYEEPTPLNIIGASSDATYSIITTTRQTQHNPTGSVFFGATGNPGFFSTIYGVVTNLSGQVSKIGNGTFKAGIWENGVWNSGWRVDEEVFDLSDIVASYNTFTKNTRWRVQISGPTSSIANFEIGDRVAISNIVAIDLNDRRNFLKNFHTIINKDSQNLVVELNNNFPYRRIEKDSENHKIRITKNIWLNGAFLNGYFEGIWNDGLFRGYPFITEMYDSHWIDGQFDGGHFYSTYPEYTFNDTLYTDGSVGLSFSTPHDFLPGDLIIIDKDDKTLNEYYDGTASITEIIDDLYVVTDIPWGSNSVLESGRVRRFTATGLIQNFKFNDRNVAPKNSRQTQNLKDIWKFNSWIDVNFSTHSSTNINRKTIFYNEQPINPVDFVASSKYGLGEFGALNLYGYITKDVLSSESSFRDIDSFINRKYSLGTKYDIYEDFLGTISEFNEPFGSNGLFGGDTNFYNNGWTFSYTGTYSYISIPIGYTFSRTTDSTLKFEFANETTQFLTLDNTNISIEKNRYSIIEFDVIKQESVFYNAAGLSPISLYNFPLFINENGIWQTGTAAFPVTQNVNYYQTPDQRKIEYFFNRPGLDIGLWSFGVLDIFPPKIFTYAGSTVELDNIKFYEVDAIPFFQYTTDDYVNISVQVPYQGRAPYIDYNNANFSYVQNIVISFDSIDINSSNSTVISSAQQPIIYVNDTNSTINNSGLTTG
jgi:hypothetical protein